MKKLLKFEWKYYLFWIIGMVVWFLFYYRDWWWHFEAVDESDMAILYADVMWNVGTLANRANGLMLEQMITILTVGLCINKAFLFWVEKDSCGRDFFQTLPVKRTERMMFHLLMDAATVIVVVVCCAIYVYCSSLWRYTIPTNIELPWFASAIAGQAISSISYLLFFLGVLNLLECFFVNGFARIVGIVEMLWLSRLSLDYLVTMKKNSTLIQIISGFFTYKGIGGQYCYDRMWGRTNWTHDRVDVEVLYKGRLLTDIVTEGDIQRLGQQDYWDEYISTLGPFKDVGSWIGYVAGYLILAAVLIGIAYYLVKRKDLSKNGFYFPAGRYVFCLVNSIGIGMAMMINSTAVWHRYLIMVSMVLVFILSSYLLKEDKKAFVSKKA